MRWLFILLLSINAMLFVYQFKGAEVYAQNDEYKMVDGANNIQMLSEQMNKEGDNRCIVIGEISDPSALTVVSDFFKNKNLEYELIEKEEEMAASFWVFSRDEINEELIDKLKKFGIDSYRVASGEWKGRLSLGLFANIDLAKDLVESLKGEGFTAEIVQKKKVRISKWLSFRRDDVEDPEALLVELNGLKINFGEIKEFFCKSIASEK